MKKYMKIWNIYEGGYYQIMQVWRVNPYISIYRIVRCIILTRRLLMLQNVFPSCLEQTETLRAPKNRVWGTLNRLPRGTLSSYQEALWHSFTEPVTATLICVWPRWLPHCCTCVSACVPASLTNNTRSEVRAVLQCVPNSWEIHYAASVASWLGLYSGIYDISKYMDLRPASAGFGKNRLHMT